tara:strand:+ start:28698 stop:29258 length:561 start_codon:yes stop_codon:yes gene_type:complete
LKEHTQPLHDEVEAAMNSGALMRPDFSRREYTLLIKRLWRAHSALEPVLENCRTITSHTELKASERLNKRSLLLKDLRELGIDEAELDETPPALLSDKECWGAFYVLEGSTLGGAMIHKKLREQQGSDFPLHFYGAYGTKTGAMWSSFREAFTHHTTPVEEWRTPVMSGAEKAYDSFLKATRFYRE